MDPITLTLDELDEVLRRISSPSGKEYGAARICRLLAKEHSVKSVRVNTICAVSNISDQVSKAINNRIDDLGLYIACVKPRRPIINRYGQHTGQMLWSFYRDDAANDPVYDNLEDELKGDLEELADNCPELLGDSSVDEWLTTVGEA